MSQQPPRVTAIKFARLQRAARRIAAKRGGAQVFQDGEVEPLIKSFIETPSERRAREKREAPVSETFPRTATERRNSIAVTLTDFRYPNAIIRSGDPLRFVPASERTNLYLLSGNEDLLSGIPEEPLVSLKKQRAAFEKMGLGFRRLVEWEDPELVKQSYRSPQPGDIREGKIVLGMSGTLDAAREERIRVAIPLLLFRLRRVVREKLPFADLTGTSQFGSDIGNDVYNRLTNDMAYDLLSRARRDKSLGVDAKLSAGIDQMEGKTGFAGVIRQAGLGIDQLLGSPIAGLEEGLSIPELMAGATQEAGRIAKELPDEKSALMRSIEQGATGGAIGAIFGAATAFLFSRNPAAMVGAPKLGLLLGAAAATPSVDVRQERPWDAAKRGMLWASAVHEWAEKSQTWIEAQNAGAMITTVQEMIQERNEIAKRYGLADISEETRKAFDDNVTRYAIERQRVVDSKLPENFKALRLATVDAAYGAGTGARDMLSRGISVAVNGVGTKESMGLDFMPEQLADKIADDVANELQSTMKERKRIFDAVGLSPDLLEKGIALTRRKAVESAKAQPDKSTITIIKRSLDKLLNFTTADVSSDELESLLVEYDAESRRAIPRIKALITDRMRPWVPEDRINSTALAVAEMGVDLELHQRVQRQFSDLIDTAARAEDPDSLGRALQSLERRADYNSRLSNISEIPYRVIPGAKTALMKAGLFGPGGVTPFVASPPAGLTWLGDIMQVGGASVMTVVNALTAMNVLDQDQADQVLSWIATGTQTIGTATAESLGRKSWLALSRLTGGALDSLGIENQSIEELKENVGKLGDKAQAVIRDAAQTQLVRDVRDFVGDTLGASTESIDGAIEYFSRLGIEKKDVQAAIQENNAEIEQRVTRALDNEAFRRALDNDFESGLSPDKSAARRVLDDQIGDESPGVVDSVYRWSKDKYVKTKSAITKKVAELRTKLGRAELTESEQAMITAEAARETGMSHAHVAQLTEKHAALSPEQIAQEAERVRVEAEQQAQLVEIEKQRTVEQRAENARKIAEFRAQAGAESERQYQAVLAAGKAPEAAPGGPEAPTGRPAAPQTPQQLLEAAQQALEIQGAPPPGYKLPPAIAKALSPELQRKALSGRLGDRLGEARVALGKPGVEGRQEFALLDKWGRPTGRTLITFAGGRTVLFRPNPTVQRAKQVLSSDTATPEQKQAATAVIKEWAARVSAPQRERAKQELALYQGTLYGPAAKQVPRTKIDAETLEAARAGARGEDLTPRQLSLIAAAREPTRRATLGEVGVQAARDAQEAEKKKREAAASAETAKQLGFTVREPAPEALTSAAQDAARAKQLGFRVTTPPESREAEAQRELEERRRLVDFARDEASKMSIARAATRQAGAAGREQAAGATRVGAALARIRAQRAKPPEAPEAPETPKPQPPMTQTPLPRLGAKVGGAIADQRTRERQASIKALSESTKPQDRELARQALEEDKKRKRAKPRGTPPAAFSEAQRAKKRKHKKKLKRR